MRGRIVSWMLGLTVGGTVASARDYSVSWDVSASGAGSSSGGAYASWDVVGQPVTGESSGGSFRLESGQMSQPGLAGFNTRIASGGRKLFYNGSGFDVSASQPDGTQVGDLDDLAVAPDKSALMAGQVASFANVSSYASGITGIMIDVEALPDDVTDSDFEVRTGNNNDIGSWSLALAPSVSLRRGAGVGASDRVTLAWPAGTLANCWVEVRVRTTPQTGLAMDDVFYFGNAVGDTGNSATDLRVTVQDALRVRSGMVVQPASVASVLDINRDKVVNATDVSLVRRSLRSTPLFRIAP